MGKHFRVISAHGGKLRIFRCWFRPQKVKIESPVVLLIVQKAFWVIVKVANGFSSDGKICCLPLSYHKYYNILTKKIVASPHISIEILFKNVKARFIPNFSQPSHHTKQAVGSSNSRKCQGTFQVFGPWSPQKTLCRPNLAS
jgi:hypothetical protein